MQPDDTTPTVEQYHGWAEQLEHEEALPSCLGRGVCQECGRPLTLPGESWQWGECIGGDDCNVDGAEYAEGAREILYPA